MPAKILLIDDDPGIRSLYGKLLKDEGYEVYIVPNAKFAADILFTLDLNLILLDINLPDFGGEMMFGRLVARIIGMGSGDAVRALGSMRRASEEGLFTKTEARWVYASALLREGERGDAASREDAIRRISELTEQFPDNPVFRKALAPAGSAP